MGKVYVCQPLTNHTASIFLPMLVTAQPPAIHPRASTLAIFFQTNIMLMLTSSMLNILTSSKPCVFECTRHKHSVRAGIAEKSPQIPFWNTAPQRTWFALCELWCVDLHICFSVRFVLSICFVKDEVDNNEVTNTIKNTGDKLGRLYLPFLTIFLMCKTISVLRMCEKTNVSSQRESQDLCICALIHAFIHYVCVHIML